MDTDDDGDEREVRMKKVDRFAPAMLSTSRRFGNGVAVRGAPAPSTPRMALTGWRYFSRRSRPLRRAAVHGDSRRAAFSAGGAPWPSPWSSDRHANPAAAGSLYADGLEFIHCHSTRHC